jgi:hypothetical protein
MPQCSLIDLLLLAMFKTNQPQETMKHNEKHLLKNVISKYKTLHDFDRFTDWNNSNNFSDQFHSKFTDLYNKIKGVK